MKANFDEIITKKMLAHLRHGGIGGSGHILHRPFNPVTNQPYTKESAIFLAQIESLMPLNDPRFCTMDEASKRLNWTLEPGSEGEFIRKRVLYTEDPFGYPLAQEKWKFQDTPQLVFSAEQFSDSSKFEPQQIPGVDILNQICDAVELKADTVVEKIQGLSNHGIDFYEESKNAPPFSPVEAQVREEMTSMLLSMDLGLPISLVTPKLWIEVMEADSTAFRKAAADAENVASYLKHFSKELEKSRPILRDNDMIAYAASIQKPMPYFDENEMAYVRMQNMKFLLEHNAALRKNQPALAAEAKAMEKEIKSKHALKPSMMKRLDLFVGQPRKNVENVLSNLASDGLSWRILPMKKLVRSVNDTLINTKATQAQRG